MKLDMLNFLKIKMDIIFVIKSEYGYESINNYVLSHYVKSENRSSRGVKNWRTSKSSN